MNTKRILGLVLTFVMLISTFVPTLSVFAEELHSHDHTQDTELNYVSLGDSMTNGIGMSGYDTTDNPNSDNDGRNGYLEIAPDAYPAQFAQWLEQFTGKDVNLTQLATSGARVEDVYYILNHGTENAFEPDAWTVHELLMNSDRWGDPNNVNDEIFNDEIANVHREAVKNADVISLATGNGNFGVFMMGRIMNLVGFGNSDDVADDIERYGYYTVENAIALCGADEELAKIVMDTYNDALAYLEGMGLPMDLITRLADLMAYTTASYVLTTIKTIDLIVEMNPDVTLIIVPLINNGQGFTFSITLHDITKTFDAGDFLGALYTPLNAFLAAYPTAKQAAGEFEDATFLYAELPVDENGETVQVETYAQAFGELYAPVVAGEAYPENRLFCHDRFIGDIRDFVFPILLGDSGVEFNKYDVMEYEIAQANGIEAFAAYVLQNQAKAQWIAQYLGIIDAVLNSLVTSGHINADELGVDTSTGLDIFSIIGPAAAGVPGAVEANIAAKLADKTDVIAQVYQLIVDTQVRPALSQAMGVDLDLNTTLNLLETNPELASYKNQAMDGAIGVVSLTVLPDSTSEELSNVGILQVLLSLYGRLKLAWGLSAHPSYKGHDTLTESLINAYENEYTTQDETFENLKVIADFIVENYDEAYAYGYQYVDQNGYIDLSVEAIDEAIDALYAAIDEVNAGTLGVTDELRDELVNELEATIETLKELREVLATDSAKDVEGLVAAVFALEDDLYTHLANIYGILEQAGIDVTNLVILPALEEALRFINEEVIPEVVAAAEAFANAVVEYVQAKLEALYTELLGVSREVYEKIVETLVRLQLYVGAKIEEVLVPIVNSYMTIVATLTKICGSVDQAVMMAAQIINNIIDTLEYLNDLNNKLENAIVETLEKVTNAYIELIKTLYETYGSLEEALKAAYAILADVVVKLDGAIADGIELYNVILNAIIKVYGDVENAVIVASQIFSYAYDFIKNNVTPENLQAFYSDIVEIVTEAYGTTQDVYYVVNQIYAYLVRLSENTFEGSYGIKADSMYVSLGSAPYGKELADMLYLTNKYHNFALNANYLDKVAEADLVTIKLDNGEVLQFAMSRVQDINSELDWDKYLDAEGQAALDEMIAKINEELLVSGKAAEMTVALQAVIDANFAESTITVNEEFVAFIIAHAVECTVYSYAEFIDRFITVLDNVYTAAPDATVVITGIQNPLYDIDLSDMGLDIDIAEIAKPVDVVIAGLNAQFIAAAFANENTIFVDSEEAEDIYDALNAYCTHAYDGCTDKECNICGETRPSAKHVYDDCEDAICNICGFERIVIGHIFAGCEATTCSMCGFERVAPGHSFTKYTNNNDATCGVDGTETAKCDNCLETDTRTIPGTALVHNWVDATCQAPITCTNCGATQGEKIDHIFSDWKTLRETSHRIQGFRERECVMCGLLEVEVIPKLEGLSTGAIVGICIGGVVVVAGAWLVIRKIKSNKVETDEKVEKKEKTEKSEKSKKKEK